MQTIELTSEIWQEGNMYTAYCHELDVATAGRTVEEAQKNLVEALEIFFEETARLGTLQELLEEAGITLNEKGEGTTSSARASFCLIDKIRLPAPQL